MVRKNFFSTVREITIFQCIWSSLPLLNRTKRISAVYPALFRALLAKICRNSFYFCRNSFYILNSGVHSIFSTALGGQRLKSNAPFTHGYDKCALSVFPRFHNVRGSAGLAPLIQDLSPPIPSPPSLHDLRTLVRGSARYSTSYWDPT